MPFASATSAGGGLGSMSLPIYVEMASGTAKLNALACGFPDIQQQTKKTVGTKNFSSSLLSKLFGDAQLGISAFGLNLGAPVVTNQVAGVLANVTAPIDGLLSSVIQTLGVGLGQADVWGPGHQM